MISLLPLNHTLVSHKESVMVFLMLSIAFMLVFLLKVFDDTVLNKCPFLKKEINRLVNNHAVCQGVPKFKFSSSCMFSQNLVWTLCNWRPPNCHSFYFVLLVMITCCRHGVVRAGAMHVLWTWNIVLKDIVDIYTAFVKLMSLESAELHAESCLCDVNLQQKLCTASHFLSEQIGAGVVHFTLLSQLSWKYCKYKFCFVARGGADYRPVIHYRDLDAPREPEEFIWALWHSTLSSELFSSSF